MPMERFRRILIYIIICVSTTHILCKASEYNDSAKIWYLPDFEVVAASERDDIIHPQILDSKRLESLNSHNVADAIRYFSGAQLKDYGGVGGVKSLDIRSMGTNHIGVFYDGIQLGNPQNGQIDLGKYSLDNIESISLYNGQKSQIFQSAKDFASASAVYIRSRRPVFSNNKNYSIGLTMRTGSFGLANPSLRFDYKFSNSVSASANVEYVYATGRYKFRYNKRFSDGTQAWDTTAIRQNGDIHTFRAEGGVFGTIDKGQWQARLYYYNSEKGIPGAIVNNVWKNSQRQWDRNFFLQSSFQKSISERYEIMVSAKYARDYMRYLNPDTTLMYIDNEFRQHEVYASVVNKFNIVQWWEASISVDYQWDKLDASLVNFSNPIRNMLLVSAAMAFESGPLRAQISLLSTNVSDRATLRYGNDVLKEMDNRLSKFTPAVAVSLNPFTRQNLDIHAFFKRIFRMPTFNDLYYTDIGNANLKPEYATQYDLGINWRPVFNKTVFRTFSFATDGYYNRVSDKIIAVPKGTSQYRWMMMNIGKVHIVGLDVSAETMLSFPYDIDATLRLTYTWQLARDYSDPLDSFDMSGTYKGQIAYIPRNSGSIVGSATWRGIGLNYSFIYVGERWHNSSNIPENYEQPWYTHDLSASYTFRIGHINVKTSLEINNLFNQQYEVIQNYPMPGRNFRFIIKIDI